MFNICSHLLVKLGATVEQLLYKSQYLLNLPYLRNCETIVCNIIKEFTNMKKSLCKGKTTVVDFINSLLFFFVML